MKNAADHFKPENLFPADIPSTWQAMEKLCDSGKARAIGVSNFSTKKLEDLLKIARISPAVNQVECHPICQRMKLKELCISRAVHLSASLFRVTPFAITLAEILDAKSGHDLKRLTIDLGSIYAKAVTKKCLSLLQSEKDPNIKAALSACASAYDLFNLYFGSIRAAFQSGRYIGQQGADARLAVSKCNITFNEKKLACPLADDNNNLLNFIQIILANAM
ncbi:hypothetical protein K7X08_037696 [Anisodus acutangulus]|uniref:NADP-dependent oxidoreductase domain-containing protein n=1 Tax=Anisodus acutangulus TaxID=402998 RepID=A0A9Q1MWY5_9SOLA|nr:hypothetical protein K7X08_037696 [Anisodus acutangulus]